ncbi:Alpha/Beta hydrolase protein [Gigaspora rosea]|uniref:Alpha/Beta hydrolase protein n=1 Tax=Gigaspora rosea TaxID=44941 RepID=A0A397VRR2_9GLOM|nr:Alpha/Beta hydrolase protein [Gigaspora rosea]
MPLLKTIPNVLSTSVNRVIKGKPRPTWNYKFHIGFNLFKSMLTETFDRPIEEVQLISNSTKISPPPDISIKENFELSDNYRAIAQIHLEKFLDKYDDVLDSKWKDTNGQELIGEWVYYNNLPKKHPIVLLLHGGYFCMGGTKMIRSFAIEIAKFCKAKVFGVDYRLSPQHQFPAALCDVIAAYLYLISPGEDAGFEPIDPKRIVIMGESAGGGLAMAMTLFLRDAGLPLPCGIVGWSPWVDLTHSMPSSLDPNLIGLDLLCPMTMYRPKPKVSSPAWVQYQEDSQKLADQIKEKKPSIIGDESFQRDEQIQIYCNNEALAIPYVSPLLAESLGNMPPMLLQVGEVERIHDEVVLFGHKATQPHKFRVPQYSTSNFDESPFQKPTSVILEVYDDMPHGWQRFPSAEQAQISFHRTCNFIKYVSLVENDLSTEKSLFKGIRINCKGEERPLEQYDLEVLNWDKVGIVPDITDHTNTKFDI